MNRRNLLILITFTMLCNSFFTQHVTHVFDNLIEDYRLYDKAYRNSYLKQTDPGAIEDWAVAQKYKVQLTDSRLLFDKAFDENNLSKEGLMEYLELLLYQRELILYHQILESDHVDRFTSEEIHHFRELSAAWRMVITQKKIKKQSWKLCSLFDSKKYYDWKNPNVEVSWIIEGEKVKNSQVNHCFHSPGSYDVTIVRKNLLTGYFLPDSTFSYTIDSPLEVEFNDQPSTAHCGDWVDFGIAASMINKCETVWTLGDGTIMIGNHIRHRFNVPGTYSVTQHLTYSEHDMDYVKSKTYQIYINREEEDTK